MIALANSEIILKIQKFNDMNSIHVVIFFDENLCVPATILAASLAKTASENRPVILHAFCCGLFCDRFAAQIEFLISPTFSAICTDIQNPFNIDNSIAYNNYLYCMRLCVGELLANDKVIYLDTDILVRGPLDALYDMNIENNIVAAVLDVELNDAFQTSNESRLKIGMTNVLNRDYCKYIVGPGGRYFNSGVMLINLQRWRNFDVKNKCLNFLDSKVLLAFCDQDALNSVLQNNVFYIDFEWNYFVSSKKLNGMSISIKPKILHYSGPAKPWSPLGEKNKYNKEYLDFALKTPIKDSFLDMFFTRVSNEITELEYQILQKSSEIPKVHHPVNTSLVRIFPLIIIKLLAEFTCTIGKGRIRRSGIEMWNIYKMKLKLLKE